MSGGGSDASQTTTQQLPPWLDAAGQYAAGQGAGLQQGAQYNPLQMGAATASGLYGQMAPGALGGAYNSFNQAAGYQPDQGGFGLVQQLIGNAPSPNGQGGGGGGGSSLGAQYGDPHQFNGSAPQAAQMQATMIDPSQLGQYQSRQLSSTNLAPYMDPYQNDVINSTMTQLNQNLAQQQASNDAGAASAGAFGGTRAGVQAALTNQAGQQTAASTIAQLNAQNFGQAQQAALTDIGNQNQASQFNNSALNAAIMANAGYGNQASQFNAQQQNALTQQGMQDNTTLGAASIGASGQATAANINANASMHNSGNALLGQTYGDQLQAALGLAGLQQSGGLSAAQLNLMGGQALQGFGQQGIGDMSTWGNQMYNQPMTNLGWYTGMLGGIPAGGSSTATGQQGSNPWAGALGGAASGAATGSMFGPWGTVIGGGVGAVGGYFGSGG